MTDGDVNIIELDSGIDFDLSEESDSYGAMICDYNTFKSIYRLNVRALDRHQVNMVLASISVSLPNDDNRSDEEKQDAFNKLGAALAGSLRRQDVVTGFDTPQFLMMISNIDIENAKSVVTRLINKINSEIGKIDNIETKLQALEPVDRDGSLNR
jgi:hypothetical protein